MTKNLCLYFFFGIFSIDIKSNRHRPSVYALCYGFRIERERRILLPGRYLVAPFVSVVLFVLSSKFKKLSHCLASLAL